MPIDEVQPAINRAGDVDVPLPPRGQPLELVSRLARMLDEQGIACCQWKGTFSKSLAAAGEKDIDLLVGADAAGDLPRILSRLGFKETQPAAGGTLPGTRNYFAYDRSADRFVHLHLHFRLVLGHPLRGAYYLPVEEAYLATATKGDLFPLPRPEFEFIVFVLRMMLDPTAWRAPRGRQRAAEALADSRAQEFAHLNAQVRRASVQALLREHLPFLVPVFDACADAVAAGAERGERVRRKRDLQRRLDAHALRAGDHPWQRGWRRLVRTLRVRVMRRSAGKRRLAQGGKVIALVGADGAGKSTAIEQLHKWLAEYFDVGVIHLGKPPRSWTTHAVRGGLRAAAALGLLGGKKRGGPPSRSAAPDVAKVVRNFCTARDRYQAYLKAQRQAARGQLVISDRWPLPDVMSMDGPQIPRAIGSGSKSWLLKLLARCEEHWLRSIGNPHLLVVLILDPEISVRRKPEENADQVRARGWEVWNAEWDETDAHLVDAAQPRASVLAKLKKLVWANL